jgi:predicted ATPase/transcriptional regulator with XRE-family HTH domain
MDTAFAALLKEYRLAAGLTQEALAERAGLGVRSIQGLERGENRPAADTLRRLADALPLAEGQRARFMAAGTPSPRRLRGGGGAAAPHHNLPLQPTALIGRERAVRELRAHVRDSHTRLLTLTEPGGIGKTRLALHLAADLLDRFADGAFFVDLAPLADPALVAATVATALGLGERGPATPAPALVSAASVESGAHPEELLVAFLRGKDLLLVLDNFERVTAAAPLLSRLLAAAPRLVLVVTSRVALHLYAEQEFPVTPLDLPPRPPPPDLAALSQYEAVALFIQRARLAQPSFAVTNETAPAVAEICARLDGLPLAIELAAARMKMLSPQALLERLSSRLRVLTGGARDLPARQQTLRAAIDWSYQLLTPPEQSLFARLAVFAGGRTLEAIEAVCNAAGDLDVFAGVESLLDKNLLRREDEAQTGEPRFVLLETLHEYAHEQLAARGELEGVRERHALYFLALAEETELALRGGQRASGAAVTRWLERLEAAHDDLRAALRWTREAGRHEEGLRLAAALFLFWSWRGHREEGRRWVEEMLAATPEPAAPLTGALAAARARVLLAAAEMAGPGTDERRRRRAHIEESLALSRAAGDRRGIAEALYYVGLETAERGDYAGAMAVLAESAALWRAVGDPLGLARTQFEAGQLAWGRGDYARTAALCAESLTVCRGLGYTLGIAHALSGLGFAAYAQGDLARARALWEEDLALCRELHLPLHIATMLGQLGYAAHAQGDLARAAALGEESLALRREGDDKWGIAHALGLLGVVAHRRGEEARAAGLLREALARWGELGGGVLTAHALEHLAEVLAAPATPCGDVRQAAVLLGAAAALRVAVGFQRPPVEQPELERLEEALRAALSPEEFAVARAEGAALSEAEAISLALSTASPAAHAE